MRKKSIKKDQKNFMRITLIYRLLENEKIIIICSKFQNFFFFSNPKRIEEFESRINLSIQMMRERIDSMKNTLFLKKREKEN